MSVLSGPVFNEMLTTALVALTTVHIQSIPRRAPPDLGAAQHIFIFTLAVQVLPLHHSLPSPHSNHLHVQHIAPSTNTIKHQKALKRQIQAFFRPPPLPPPHPHLHHCTSPPTIVQHPKSPVPPILSFSLRANLCQVSYLNQCAFLICVSHSVKSTRKCKRLAAPTDHRFDRSASCINFYKRISPNSQRRPVVCVRFSRRTDVSRACRVTRGNTWCDGARFTALLLSLCA